MKFLSAEISFIYKNLHTRPFEHDFIVLYKNIVSKSTTVQIWQLLNTKRIQKTFLMYLCRLIVMNNFFHLFSRTFNLFMKSIGYNNEVHGPASARAPPDPSQPEPKHQPVPISGDVSDSQELDLPWCSWLELALLWQTPDEPPQLLVLTPVCCWDPLSPGYTEKKTNKDGENYILSEEPSKRRE